MLAVVGERLHDSPLLDDTDLGYHDVQADLLYHLENWTSVDDAIDSVLLVPRDEQTPAMAELGVRVLMGDPIRRGDLRRE